jgi:hypothetical protein
MGTCEPPAPLAVFVSRKEPKMNILLFFLLTVLYEQFTHRAEYENLFFFFYFSSASTSHKELNMESPLFFCSTVGTGTPLSRRHLWSKCSGQEGVSR